MKGKPTICIALIMLLGAMTPLMAQVSIDHYQGDGTHYVCSQEEVMYENFFHGARFAVAIASDPAGMMSFSLVVTYDEGMLDVSKGDSLTLVLRGGDKVILKAERDVTRGDILRRHFKGGENIYYVTCHYAMSTYDVQRISRNRVTKLSAQAGEFTFDRKLDKFQDRFRRQFTSVYRYLMNDKRHR